MQDIREQNTAGKDHDLTEEQSEDGKGMVKGTGLKNYDSLREEGPRKLNRGV